MHILIVILLKIHFQMYMQDIKVQIYKTLRCFFFFYGIHSIIYKKSCIKHFQQNVIAKIFFKFQQLFT
jgi:hypothetical protein